MPTNQPQRVNPQQVIREALGAYIVHGKVYWGTLANELAPWYCYTVDGGHSIVVVLKSAWDAHNNDEPITDYLVPAPVRSVERAGVTATPEGYLICDLPYDARIGLIVPTGDDEY